MTKHAYLIIAHHEFELLQRLVTQLDDERNDIYIHYDKKIVNLPKILVDRSTLYILDRRIDVRWGDVSQIESEFILFQEAYKKRPYVYYHTLSGVDFPLKNQNEIHRFFQLHQGKEFIGFSQGDLKEEIERKVKKYHLFPKYFKAKQKGMLFHTAKIIRAFALKMQVLFKVERFKGVDLKKGTSWVSVTQDFVEFLLPHYTSVMKMYRKTYCADEIFLHTICWNSPFREAIYDLGNERNGCQRMIGWQNGELHDWTEKDFDALV